MNPQPGMLRLDVAGDSPQINIYTYIHTLHYITYIHIYIHIHTHTYVCGSQTWQWKIPHVWWETHLQMDMNGFPWSGQIPGCSEVTILSPNKFKYPCTMGPRENTRIQPGGLRSLRLPLRCTLELPRDPVPGAMTLTIPSSCVVVIVIVVIVLSLVLLLLHLLLQNNYK